MEGIPTGNGVVSVTVNNVVKATMDVAQGAVEIDLTPYMTASVNRVEVRVTDIEGQYKRINYSITVMQLSLSSTFDVATPYTGRILRLARFRRPCISSWMVRKSALSRLL